MLRSQHDDRDVVSDRYLLGDVLGRGSSAVVYRAVDLRTEREVAVKLFTQGATADHRRRRSRELRVLAGLDHPNLVRLLDGDVTGERPFLATELVEGPSLAEALTDGPMPPMKVARVGAQLAQALAVVHAAGLVHRDVKPANVLLDAGRARLTDFGIARVLDTGGTSTTSGATPGTAAYMAPEQVCGDVVEPPADIYSLGLVLIEAAKGAREYPGGAVESAIARLTRPPVVPDGLPVGMGAALALMTDTDPEERPTAEETAALLGAVETGSRVAVVWARHWRPATAALAVAGAALALTGMWPTVHGGAGSTPPVAAPYGAPVISGPDGSVPALPGAADPLVGGGGAQPLLAAQEGALPAAPAVAVPQPAPRLPSPSQQVAPAPVERPAPTGDAPPRVSGGSSPAPAPAPAPSRGGGGGSSPAPAPAPAPSTGGGGGSGGQPSNPPSSQPSSPPSSQPSSPPPTTGGGSTPRPNPEPEPEPQADRPGRAVGRDGGTPPGQAGREESGKPVPPGQGGGGNGNGGNGNGNGGGNGNGKGKGGG